MRPHPQGDRDEDRPLLDVQVAAMTGLDVAIAVVGFLLFVLLPLIVLVTS